MTLAKNMISFNGYLVTDYHGATTIYIEKSKDKKDIHGNPVRTGLLNLSDAIRTKKNEDIDYKSIYYYCKSIFDKNFDKNNNSDIVKFDETAKINNAKKSNIIIQKCTVPNMEAVFDIDTLKKSDPQMAKDLNIIFKYAKHVLQYKYGFDQMSELVLSGSFHNTDALNVLLFTFRKDNPGTSVPSCTISITSVFVDGYKEKDTDDTFEIDEAIGDKISGSIDVTNDGYFNLSIPYDKGFIIKVDGKKIDYEKVNKSFIGFPIKKGEHNIEIEFEAPNALFGKIVSALGFGIFIIMIMYDRFRGKVNG